MNDRAAQVWTEAHKAYYPTWSTIAPQKAVEVIAAYGQEQYRAGIEKMRKRLCICHDKEWVCNICSVARKLTEQEEKE